MKISFSLLPLVLISSPALANQEQNKRAHFHALRPRSFNNKPITGNATSAISLTPTTDGSKTPSATPSGVNNSTASVNGGNNSTASHSGHSTSSSSSAYSSAPVPTQSTLPPSSEHYLWLGVEGTLPITMIYRAYLRRRRLGKCCC